MDKVKEKDIFFSIYQDPNSSEPAHFSMQQVNRKQYYSEELSFLVNKIESLSSPIDIQRAVDQFNQFVKTRKDELVQLYHQCLRREKVNQRYIYTLVDEFGKAIYQSDQSDLVYIGGPLGGGKMKLNESLNEIEQVKDLALISIDGNDVGIEINSIELDLEFEKYVLNVDNYNPFTLITFPIETRSHILTIKRASVYFEDEYQKLSTLDDFAPIVDPAIIAAMATIEANLLYCCNLPDLVLQKLIQYNLSNSDYDPDFLGIRQILNTPINQKHLIQIQGFSFIEHHREYSFVMSPLYNNLKCIILGETQLSVLHTYHTQLLQDSELKWQISDIQRDNKSLNKISHRNSIGVSPIIRELVGIHSIKSNIIQLEDQIHVLEIPIGFISVDYGDLNAFINSSFMMNELPLAYTRILFDFKNALELLRSGPLDTLSFNADLVSCYLGTRDNMVKIEYRQSTDLKFEFVVYIIVNSLPEAEAYFQSKNKTLTKRFLHNITIPLVGENYSVIKEELGINTTITKGAYDKSITEFPLSRYVETILSDKVVSVLLKRIISEIRETEVGYMSSDQYFDNTSESLNTVSELNNDYLSIPYRQTIYDQDTIQSKQNQLESDMNHFNPGLYSFISDMLRRERPQIIESRNENYTTLLNLYHDITIALVDFGLSPEQWKVANNLSLWNSYQAQINYMEHTIINELRKILGEEYEGDGLDNLVNHKFTRSLNYPSFHGTVDADRYLQLKKVLLTFIPKIHTFSNELNQMRSFTQLISELENLEMKRRANLSLPNLPTLRPQNA